MKTQDGRVFSLAFASALALSEFVVQQSIAAQFVTVNPMNNARSGHTATLLPNGKVLVAGGADTAAGGGFRALSSAELYDPATGTWTPTRAMRAARVGHTATLLRSGKVLAAGGWETVTSTELYDPDTGTWTLTGTMTRARFDHRNVAPRGKGVGCGWIRGRPA